MIRASLAALLLLSPLAARAQQVPVGARLSAEQVRRDMAILRRTMVELHPGLYRYLAPAQFDSIFTDITRPLAAGATRGELYLAATRIAAAARCGHTWTNPLNQAPAVMEELFRRQDKLPLRLELVEDRFLVLASAVPEVHAGDELVAVQGISSAEIVREALPYLRADGASDGKRRAQLSHGTEPSAMDALFPLLHPPVGGRYELMVRARSAARAIALSVAATTTARRDSTLVAQGNRLPATDWSFAITGDTAVMTLPTFVVRGAKTDWKAWLRDAFTQLDERRIPLLVLDIRRNEGGDGEVVDSVLSYLVHESRAVPVSRPESAYERVPYVLARFLETWDFGFFDRTGKVVKTQGRNWQLSTAPAIPDTVRPAARRYRGTTVLLVGPENSSAGFLLARRAKESHVALVVGQPTGGNYRGLNGGELAWVTLPNSGVAVDIPLIAWMPATPQFDTPVIPDVVVPHPFEAVARGADVDREAVTALVRRGVVRPAFQRSVP